MHVLPRTFGPAYRSLISIGLLCVCIVTLGIVCPCRCETTGPPTPTLNHHALPTGEVKVMGLKTSSSSSGGDVSVDDEASFINDSDSADVLRSYQNQLNDPGAERELKERLRANPGVRQRGSAAERHAELDNPHPHISAPQLPFCKPTKTTIGGGGNTKSNAGRSKRSQNDRSSSRNMVDPEDDVEIINASGGDGIVETDRKYLVATLDGKVTLLNRTGHQLWSVKTGPLFSSTISSLQLNENGKWVNLIPSLTGGVYKYDGDSLYPMPFNADSLLKKSFKLSNDVVITGGKELRTLGVDVNTGNIRYDCGISGCVNPRGSELKPSGRESSEDSVVLVVKKQMQTVRAIDSSTGVEKWNFSVGTHELALAGLTEGCYHGEQRDSSARLTDFLKIVIPEGKVYGADRENQVIWDQQFEAPISQAWILENGQLVSVDPITNTPLTDVPSLYVGIHNQQFYVQESQKTADKMDRFFELDSVAHGLVKKKPLNIGWKSPTAIDGVSGSTALSTIQPKPNWVTFSPTPNFRPVYIYDRDIIGDVAFDVPNTTETDDDDDDDADSESEGNPDEVPPNLDFTEGITQVIVLSLWFWWKEVLGISLFTAVLLNLILMKPIMRAVRSATIREMTGYFQRNFQQLWNRFKEEEETRELLERHSSNQLCLPPATASVEDDEQSNNTVVEVDNRKRSTSCSSTGSMHSPGGSGDDREIPFNSQYLNEFIPIACLGRGGFGVVFEAKKKIDDQTYAVKRITLPDREKARVRVMREVKALAQLGHRNIVRYFNAWIESPPPGWLEKNDPLWAKSLIGSTSPTMDYPSDMLASSMAPEYSKRGKPDHSKISVPATPSEDPNVREDSYIVFETSTTNLLSRDCLTGVGSTIAKDKTDNELTNDTSIRIPASVDTSVASSVSSVGGGGFFARRPTSLNIQSSVSSFHDDDDDDNDNLAETSQNDAIIAMKFSGFSKKDEKEISKMKESDEISQDVMYLYIQQELCQKRTLQDWLRSERSRELSLVIKIFSQIVEAVEYVHSKKLIHRDLKPSNIFLAEVTENGMDILTVKIGDFGLATTVFAELENEKVLNGSPVVEGKGGAGSPEQCVRINLTGHVGTHLYMSPEQYQRRPYDYKVDIYSLGLIFFELLVPFSTDMERYNTLSGVRKLRFPASFTDSFGTEYELIRTMISHNPIERPDAATINTWVKNHILNLSGSAVGPRSRESSGSSGDIYIGRSVSSPAEIENTEDSTSSLEKRKLKSRFYKKTQSVM